MEPVLVVQAVCKIIDNTGELVCTMSMASVTAVLFLAIIGVAFQVWRIVENKRDDRK